MTEEEKYEAFAEAEVQKELNRIQQCLKTAQVKTASPSRSGFKVQVRVAWKEPGGKPGLGYFAVSTADLSKQTSQVNNPQALMRDFTRSVFRTRDWAIQAIGRNGGVNYGWTDLDTKIITHLEAVGEFTTKSKLDRLSQHAMKEMRNIVASGKDQRVKRIRVRSKARDYLYQAIVYGLQSGLRDDEVRELVKQALVEHTMKS